MKRLRPGRRGGLQRRRERERQRQRWGVARRLAVLLLLFPTANSVDAQEARPVAVGLRPSRIEGQEAAWFALLPRVNLQSLQPGDVLIRKVYDDDHKVKTAQKTFFRYRGAGAVTSVHAMLYLGKGMVAEASRTAKRVLVAPLKTEIDLIVWRPTSRRQAESAVATATWLAEQGIGYSVAHCLMSTPRSSSWGPQAAQRAAQIARRELPTRDMMCSEFVSFCFQGIASEPYILMDAMRVAPMRLEDYLNSNPDRFAFVGVHAARLPGNPGPLAPQPPTVGPAAFERLPAPPPLRQ